MTKVDEWIRKQNDKTILVSGHSKGATMSMIAAARHPKKIKESNCLNPTGLSMATLARLVPNWMKQKIEEKPEINVFVSEGDPAFPLESGFLAGTQLYRLKKDANQKSPMNCAWLPNFLGNAYSAHICHYLGFNKTQIEPIDISQENLRLKRSILDEIKDKINWLRFPLEYLEFVVKIMTRKIERYFDERRKAAVSTIGLFLPIFSPLVVKVITKTVTVLAKLTHTILSIAAHITAIAWGVMSFFLPRPSIVDPNLILSKSNFDKKNIDEQNSYIQKNGSTVNLIKQLGKPNLMQDEPEVKATTNNSNNITEPNNTISFSTSQSQQVNINNTP